MAAKVWDAEAHPVAIDLFAGAGGLSLGAEMAGVEVALANDIFPEAAATYQVNNPGTLFVEAPIETLTAPRILDTLGIAPGTLDIMLGGPPCQGFSINAPTRSLGDVRNSLVLEYLRLVDGLRPKYLVIENVPGLLSLERGHALHVVYERLAALGYQVAHKVMLAARYGVPQERWRLIILGHRMDMPAPQFPVPTHHATARANFTEGARWAHDSTEPPGLPPAVTVVDAIDDLPPLGNGEGASPVPYHVADRLSPFQTWARTGARALYNHQAPKLSAINLQRLQHVPPGGNWTDIPCDLLPTGMRRARRSDHTKRYGRLDPQGQSCTILTKCDPHWGSFFHYAQDRAITPREAARLQGFPDRYVFTGPGSLQYEQIGNAVPPLLAQSVVAEIVKVWARVEAPRARARSGGSGD
jgi:DNA (cytosine-5)-methyltransferase 1